MALNTLTFLKTEPPNTQERVLQVIGKTYLNKEYKMTDIKAVEYEKQEVTIDNETYFFEDLPQQVQHGLSQISLVRSRKERAILDVQEIEMMEAGYVNMLKEAMIEFKK